MMIYEHFTIPA